MQLLVSDMLGFTDTPYCTWDDDPRCFTIFCLNILEMDVWLKVDEFSRSSPGTFPTPQSSPAPFPPQIGAVSWRLH
jgi:hypothetical protein